MIFKIKFKNKTLGILEVKECKGIRKAVGLMFLNQHKAKALLFRFHQPTKISIHSFFCPNFLAIWLRNGKIVEYKFIKEWNFYIKPSHKFNALIEIPLNKRYKDIIKKFANTTVSSVKT